LTTSGVFVLLPVARGVWRSTALPILQLTPRRSATARVSRGDGVPRSSMTVDATRCESRQGSARRPVPGKSSSSMSSGSPNSGPRCAEPCAHSLTDPVGREAYRRPTHLCRPSVPAALPGARSRLRARPPPRARRQASPRRRPSGCARTLIQRKLVGAHRAPVRPRLLLP